MAAARRLIRWVRLTAECECGEPWSELIPATERLRYRGDAVEAVVRRSRCRARGCGRLVEITAGAYVEAGETLEPESAAG